ncbi:MAG: nitrate- and nitrite sensing domain-containing protein, partial [Acidimicrobiales bacterium]
MKVGTKLAAILVAPLVMLAVLAGAGVRERLEQRNDARDVERLADYAGASANALQQVQLEALRSAVMLAKGGQAGRDELKTQRESTDLAAAALRRSARDAAGAEFSLEFRERLRTAQERLSTLPTLRQEIDAGGLNAGQASGRFADIAGGGVNAIAAGARAVPQPELAARFDSLAALGAAKAASAELSGLVLGAAGATRLGAVEELRRGVAAAESRDRSIDRFRESDDANLKAQQRNEESSGESQEHRRLVDQFVGAAQAATIGAAPSAGGPGPAIELPTTVDAFAALAENELNGLLRVEESLDERIADEAAEFRGDAEQSVLLYLGGAVAGILAAVALAGLVARAVARPLRQLTAAANQLASVQLPALVERLRSPAAGAQVGEVAPIPVRSRDEVGQLASAFNSIQEVTVRVAEDQSTLLRKGISDIFVNLARRNQTLLDRQIEFIDQLEAHEESPDQLENLFRLDHLATRMRRNAESLLVLAGAEPSRRRGRAVSLADVVRVAISEVEDFARISVVSLDDVTVDSAVGVDLAHLLSELMENATQFSAPDTTVEVVGNRVKDGSYLLSVTDQGIGMTIDQLSDANQLLADPPLVGLAMTRSLGFTVVGRLAARLGVAVRLTTSPNGGVSALVAAPASLISEVVERPAPALGGARAALEPAAVPPASLEAEAAPGLVARHAVDRALAGIEATANGRPESNGAAAAPTWPSPNGRLSPEPAAPSAEPAAAVGETAGRPGAETPAGP